MRRRGVPFKKGRPGGRPRKAVNRATGSKCLQSIVFPALVTPSGNVIDPEHVETYDVSRPKQRAEYERRLTEKEQIYKDWNDIFAREIAERGMVRMGFTPSKTPNTRTTADTIEKP